MARVMQLKSPEKNSKGFQNEKIGTRYEKGVTLKIS